MPASPLRTTPPPAQRQAAKEAVKKVPPPTPPLVIRDLARGWSYKRVGFLGEGGFARVYEVEDDAGHRRAVKVVSKAAIKTKKNKTKLWAEIKLHQALSHPHIVRFDDCFEDEENVYMIMELCENGSLMDLLRRRHRYTEPEARYFLVQLIAACQYMHSQHIIHRDLKLGNLFLDRNMDVKVGDFGLAALIEKVGDRKKTICGTPNYIAPEVLFDTANGHSFEVDVWSIGVILYTLLIGKPPFQTKDVKAIYKRIRDNRYEFPQDKEISESAQELIYTILNTDPDKRPTLDEILTHRFFTHGAFPAYIPHSANDIAPDFRSVGASQSRRNFERLKQKAAVGVAMPIVTDRSREPLGPSIVQQERDFKKAVQPDSPISALISSARQPLVVAPPTVREPSLLRKLTAAGAQSTLSPVRRQRERTPQAPRRLDRLGEEDEDEEGQRELATQKARIVSQMAQPHARPMGDSPRPPRHAGVAATSLPTSRTPAVPVLQELRYNPPAAQKGKERVREPAEDRMGLFDVVAQNLDTALKLSTTDAGFQTPEIELCPVAPKVFVVSWLDYCNKYGMGFAMTDGSLGVHFNDSHSLVLSPGKDRFDHIQPAATPAPSDLVHGVRRNYAIDEFPRQLDNKVYLLKHFVQYMLERLFGDQEYTFEDRELKKGMVFVTRYLRMKHVILFRLSNDVLQFNFFDHTKLILSSDGLVVSVVDKHYQLRTWSLEALLRPMPEDTPSKDKRRVEGVIHKVQYARDVLAKIRTHAQPAKGKDEAKCGPETVRAEDKAVQEIERLRVDDRRPIR